MSDLQIQGEVVVSADKAEATFDRLGDKATQMATDVAGAAGKAGQAVDGIGAGAEKSADRFTRAEARMRDAIQKSTQELQLLGKTASEKLEFNIATKGLDAGKFAPYIAELKQVEAAQLAATGGLGKMGVSAAQTAAAMRQVPAQFTDIIVSLQAGQAPLTVLLQQGGQLKDMFGGVGNAARALGGYVLGLLSPLTLVGAAIAGIGVAYALGSKEETAFKDALVISGNAAGTTSAQLRAYAQEISAMVGTQGKAAESLTAFAQSGKVGSDNLKSFAQSAIEWERATGTAIDKTVEKFAALAKDPVEASIKLNEELNYLTVSVYKQIKALDDQGRATEAADMAQKAFASTLSERSGEITRNLGTVERGWIAIKDAVKAAGDAILSVGRASTPADQLADVRRKIADRENQLANGGFSENGGGAAFGRPSQAVTDRLRSELSGLQAQAAALEGVASATRVAAESERERAEQTRAFVQWDKEGDQFKQKSAKRAEEVEKAEIQGQKLIAAGLLTEAELRERIADINKKYQDKSSGAAGTGQAEVAAIRARVIEQTNYLELLRSQGAQAEKTTEGEKLVIKIQEELKTSISGVARAEKEKALVAAQALALVDRQVASEQDRIKALKASEAALNGQIDAVRKQADSVLEQAAGQEAVNANMGKSKTAIEQATLAQLKLQLAEADSSDRFAPAYVAALAAKTVAQERFVAALQKAEFLQKSASLTEAGRVAAEEAVSLELQLSLMGRSQQERERIIAQRQVEVRLAKELADIEKLNLGDGPAADAARADLRAKARANAVVEANNAASRAVLSEWQRTADIVNQSLTDALLRGFESGKSFARNLRDTLVNMFKTLVLRPIISFIVNPISGAISGVVNSGLSALGLGSNLLGGSGLVGGALSTVGGWLGLGGAAASGLGLAASAGAGLSLAGAGTGLGLSAGLGSGLGLASTGAGLGMTAGSLGAGSIGAGIGTSAAAGGAAAGGVGITGALAAVPVWGWALAAVAALASVVGKGETRSGGQFGVAFNGEVDNNRRGQTYTYQGQQYDRDFSGGRRDALVDGQAYRLEGDPLKNEQTIRDAVAGTAMGINELFKALGSKASLGGFWAGLETSGKGRGGVFAGGVLADGTAFGESGKGDNYAGTLYEKFSTNSPDFDTAVKDFALDLKQTTIQALQAAKDIPQSIQDKIKDIDAEALTDESANALLSTINAQILGVTQLKSAFDSMGMDSLASMSFDAAAGLAEAAGGFDKLLGSLNTFYSNFYSPEEQRNNVQRQLQEQLQALGLQLPDINAADAREQYRAMVEAASKDESEAGKKLYTTLLSLSGAFASITKSSEDAARAQQEQVQAAQKAADDAARAAAEAQRDMLEAQRDALQVQRDLIEESLGQLQGLFDLVSSTSRDLFGQVEQAKQMQAKEGRTFIAQSLAAARSTGYLPDVDKLGEAISAARGGIDGGTYASTAQQDYERLVVGNQLKALELIVGPQKTAAEQQLEVMKAQLKSLDDNIKAVNGTTGAVYNLGTSLSDYDQQQRIAAVRSAFTSFSDDPLRVAQISRAAGWTMQDFATAFNQPLAGVQAHFAQFGISDFSNGVVLAQLEARYAEMKSNFATFTDDPQRVYQISKSKGWTTADIAGAYKMDLQQVRNFFLSQGIPAFAVGTNYVPRDMLAQIHEGEAIVPKAFNPWAGGGVSGGSNDALVNELLTEIRLLRAQVNELISAQDEGNGNTGKFAGQFDNWTMGGQGAARVEVMDES